MRNPSHPSWRHPLVGCPRLLIQSRTNRRICAVIKIPIKECLIVGPLFPRRVSKRCPAIMFAVNRTACVPGRIIFLTGSMHTINGISAAGVPCGTKCSNIWFVLLIHPNIINLTHKGSANVNVIVKCLVLVKINGNSPRKLLNRISENNEWMNVYWSLYRSIYG
jgi:hypothetical protein